MAMPVDAGRGSGCCLLVLVTTISAPFSSARAALYPDILAGDRYVLGTAVTLTTIQFAQVMGFASGRGGSRLPRRPDLARWPTR